MALFQTMAHLRGMPGRLKRCDRQMGQTSSKLAEVEVLWSGCAGEGAAEVGGS